MSTRSMRAVRGGLFALLATLAAAAAHTLAGGGAPSPLFCLVLAALSAPAATALAGARPALWRTALAVGGAQALFHTAFAGAGDIGAWGAAAVHVHGAVPALSAIPATSAAPDAAMTVAHAVAAVVTILAVHRGEHVVRAVAGWLLPRMLRRFAVSAVRVPARAAAALCTSSVALPRPRPGAEPLTRRGPPPALASASIA